jgi:uncharacterized protein YcgL (UPF0745 family)
MCGSEKEKGTPQTVLTLKNKHWRSLCVVYHEKVIHSYLYILKRSDVGL